MQNLISISSKTIRDRLPKECLEQLSIEIIKTKTVYLPIYEGFFVGSIYSSVEKALNAKPEEFNQDKLFILRFPLSLDCSSDKVYLYFRDEMPMVTNDITLYQDWIKLFGGNENEEIIDWYIVDQDEIYT